MRSKLPIFTLVACSCVYLACIDSHDEMTMRAAGNLAEKQTIGGPITGEALAAASIRGEVTGDAKILRDGTKARVLVDVQSAAPGHYQALLGEAIPCKFDPSDRAGGALSEDIPPA